MTTSPFSSPIGSTPFGIGTPDDAPADVGPSIGARYIDLVERDYRLVDGDYARMPETRQRVILALLRVAIPRRIDPAALAQLQSSARAALQFLVDDGVVRIDSITMENTQVGRVAPVLSFTDLTTGERDDLKL